MRFKLMVLASFVVATPAHAEWWKATTDHFTVYSETDKTDAENFARKLERLDLAMRTMQNVAEKELPTDATKVTVYRFGNTTDIGKLATGRTTSGVAGFYIPRASGPVAFTPAHEGSRGSGSKGIRRLKQSETNLDATQVLFHEYAHHFMLQHFASTYPSWYVEGFAENYATLQLNEDGSFHIGDPPNYRSYDLFENGVFPVKNLFQPEKDASGYDRYNYYSTGWLLIHYLTYNKQRAGQLNEYLSLVASGKTSMNAATEAFGDLDKLSDEIQQYKWTTELPGFDVKRDDYTPPEVELRKLTSGEQAMMNVIVHSKRGVNEKDAANLVREARDAAQGSETDPFVQTALAEAEFDAKDYDAAEAAADRALASDPEAVDALVYKGLVDLERAKADPAYFQIARTQFIEANNIAPQDPLPLIELYKTYYKAGEQPSEMAIIGLENAYTLAPYAEDMRLLLARQLIIENRLDAAHTVLFPVAFSRPEGKLGNNTRKVLELTDESKRDEALAKIDKVIGIAENPDDDDKDDGDDGDDEDKDVVSGSLARSN